MSGRIQQYLGIGQFLKHQEEAIEFAVHDIQDCVLEDYAKFINPEFTNLN